VATTARIDPPITPDATVRIVTGTGGIVSVMSCTVRRGWGRVLHLIHRTVVLGVSEKPRALGVGRPRLDSSETENTQGFG
jgi:hypothetical protein